MIQLHTPFETEGIRVLCEETCTRIFIDAKNISVSADLNQSELEWLVDQLQRARVATCI